MTYKVVSLSAVWFLISFIAGALGFTASLVPPAPQIILFGLVVILFLLFLLSPGFKSWCLTVDVRVLVLIHVTRFIGIYFLILYSEGKLPYNFAVPGGWGDIIVAALALIVVLFIPPKGGAGSGVYFLWNLIGFIDILYVISTAATLAISDPVSMSRLVKLPLSLLPTFLVPIIIFTHIVVFIRLYRIRGRDQRTI
ncbi:MAG: hypothetical protein RIG61_13695 [Deltaproteobacteria bacterium]